MNDPFRIPYTLRIPALRVLAAICGTLLLASGVAAQRRTVPSDGTPAPARAVAPKHEHSVPFAAGETLAYDVSWSSYVTAGTATLRVAEKKPSYNSVAYYIVAEGRPTELLSKLYTLYYKVDTLLDVYTLQPQRASVYSEEGKRHRMKTTMFDQPKKRAEYQVESPTVVSKVVPISPIARDPLGAVYVLRAIPLKVGERMTMPIFDSGTSYPVLITGGPIEPVKTGAGTIQAQQFTLMPQGANIGARGLTLWLSTDAAHVPVKMTAQFQVGLIALTLSSRK
jgi:hypothetical protein